MEPHVGERDEIVAYYSGDRLLEIFHKTNGNCACCRKLLVFGNYGERGGTRGRWEVAHGNPRANGGSDNLRNLWAMCFDCNRQMGAVNHRRFCG
jgi:5-methylcytosine-specific restriction endonuclease McrA